MRKLRLRASRASAVALCGLALAIAAGGGALAAKGGGGTTITVCVKEHGGTLYRAKRCNRHDEN